MPQGESEGLRVFIIVVSFVPCPLICIVYLAVLQPCFCDVHSSGQRCQCGEPKKDHHSVALGDYFGTAMVSHWDSAQHSSEAPTDAFGEVEFDGASKRHSYVSDQFVAHCII